MTTTTHRVYKIIPSGSYRITLDVAYVAGRLFTGVLKWLTTLPFLKLSEIWAEVFMHMLVMLGYQYLYSCTTEAIFVYGVMYRVADAIVLFLIIRAFSKATMYSRAHNYVLRYT